uniref:HECT-type E3 ubiquitin transferase n=1 Tax=Globisporangium ultimum (strain ATCC 200006 / CBS 805.95 / DAOM BR144) TaxID=431595 RepID=K3X473_GLOUD
MTATSSQWGPLLIALVVGVVVLVALSRKEWVRKTDVENQLFWYQSTIPGPGEQFPGFVVSFDQEAETPPVEEIASCYPLMAPVKVEIEVLPPESPPSGHAADPPQREVSDLKTVFAKEAVTQSLEIACAFQTLVLTDAALVDASKLPIADTFLATTIDWKSMLMTMMNNFPTVYAHFVAKTATLLGDASCQYVKLNIRRDHLVYDSMEALSTIPRPSVRSAMRINFTIEQGVDGGGLQREWFMLLNLALADPATGVFRCVDMNEQIFYLNSNSAHDIGNDHLLYFYATGRFIGRALLEGHVLNFHLALPLLKIILGIPVTLGDLEDMDPEAYKSMLWMMENDGVGDLDITFSMTEKRGDDDLVVIDLIENGRNIDVTDENKDLYLERRFRYLLFESVASQLYVFLKGIYEVIPPQVIMLFDPEELGYVLCGDPQEIDVDDWERHTVVSANLQPHNVLKWFWAIVREMPNEYRRRLLHFATGSSRVPIGGFAALTSIDGRLCRFTLNGVMWDRATACITASCIVSRACLNRLDVPLFDSKELLEMAIYSILDTELHGFTTD